MEDRELEEELRRIREVQETHKFFIHKVLHVGAGLALGWLAAKMGIVKMVAAII